MTIDIKTLSENELEQTIEKTKEALKLYEAELKVRQLPVPLGVPARGMWYISGFGYVDMDDTSFTVDHYNDTFNSFPSKESAKKHSEMMVDWRRELVSAEKGKPIDIEVLKPFLRKGWVAMDKDGRWFWYSKVPLVNGVDGGWTLLNRCGNDDMIPLDAFNFKPAANWAESLQECGL